MKQVFILLEFMQYMLACTLQEEIPNQIPNKILVKFMLKISKEKVSVMDHGDTVHIFNYFTVLFQWHSIIQRADINF